MALVYKSYFISVIYSFYIDSQEKWPISARFNKDWLLKEQYKSWLTPQPQDNTKAKCKLCMKTFLLSNMGEVAIRSHASGKKHVAAVCLTRKVEPVSDFFSHTV